MDFTDEQRDTIRELLEREIQDVNDGIALTRDDHTVEEEVAYLQSILNHPNLLIPEQPDICGAALHMGFWSTECDLDPHPGDPNHEGDNPYDDNRQVKWVGGGSIQGDRLPVHKVEIIKKEGK